MQYLFLESDTASTEVGMSSMEGRESLSQMSYIESDLDPCMSGAQTDLNDETLVLSGETEVNIAGSYSTGDGLSTPGRDLPGRHVIFVKTMF